MLFSNKKEKQSYELILNNVKIKKVLSTEFVGVYIDHILTWKESYQVYVAKCTAIINRIKHIVSKD